MLILEIPMLIQINVYICFIVFHLTIFSYLFLFISLSFHGVHFTFYDPFALHNLHKTKTKIIHLLAYEIQSTNSIRFIIVIFIIGIVIFRTKTNWFFRLMFYVHWISLWNWHWCECMFAITDSKHAWGWSAFRLHFSFDLTLLTLDHSICTSTWGDESKQSKIDGRLLSTEKTTTERWNISLWMAPNWHFLEIAFLNSISFDNQYHSAFNK